MSESTLVKSLTSVDSVVRNSVAEIITVSMYENTVMNDHSVAMSVTKDS